MIVVPSQNARTDTSRPVINSSITILLPALPKCLSNMISFTPALASSKSLQINTPLPRARPSAFNTIGNSAVSRYANAASALSNVSYAAVGISYFFIRSFENALDPSMIAAFLRGPNTLMFSFSKASTQPATNGSSGPTITKSIAFSFANATSLSKSITEISTHSASSAIPALPGAAYIFDTRLLFATQVAIACSLPPLPMIKTFMIILLFSCIYSLTNPVRISSLLQLFRLPLQLCHLQSDQLPVAIRSTLPVPLLFVVVSLVYLPLRQQLPSAK